MEGSRCGIQRYQKEILRLLKDLWKQQDIRMWVQIYTILKCFARDKEGAA